MQFEYWAGGNPNTHPDDETIRLVLDAPELVALIKAAGCGEFGDPTTGEELLLEELCKIAEEFMDKISDVDSDINQPGRRVPSEKLERRGV